MSQSQVLVQWPGPQLLVGGDDVDALLHPLKVQRWGHFTGCCIDDDCVGNVAVGQVIGKACHVYWLCLPA